MWRKALGKGVWVQFALPQSLGLEAMMLFCNNDAGIANNRQGAFHVSWIENKQNYQGLLGEKGSDVQKPSLTVSCRETAEAFK